jgi:hypothetical protein
VEAILHRIPFTEPIFDCAHRLCVPLVGIRPAIQDFRAPFGEIVEAVLHRLEMVLRLPPLVEGKAEPVDLGLKVGSLFQRCPTIHKVESEYKHPVAEDADAADLDGDVVLFVERDVGRGDEAGARQQDGAVWEGLAAKEE